MAVILGESEATRIARKSGRKFTNCKCNKCKSQCQTPCLGTPEDIEKLIDAGYASELCRTEWASGIIMGVTTELIPMIQAEATDAGCIFFKDGLCELHDLGLKPLEGRLSHHSIKIDNFNPKKSLAWLIAKEWIDERNADTIQRIKEKLIPY